VVARGGKSGSRLDPTEGREIQKTRPCLVVSPAEINDYLDTVIVVPMTGGQPAGYRIEANLKGKAGRFLLEQIRAIDRSRLLRRVGEVEPKILASTLETLRTMFAP